MHDALEVTDELARGWGGVGGRVTGRGYAPACAGLEAQDSYELRARRHQTASLWPGFSGHSFEPKLWPKNSGHSFESKPVARRPIYIPEFADDIYCGRLATGLLSKLWPNFFGHSFDANL